MAIKCNKCKFMVVITRAKVAEGEVIKCGMCGYHFPYQYSRDRNNL